MHFQAVYWNVMKITTKKSPAITVHFQQSVCNRLHLSLQVTLTFLSILSWLITAYNKEKSIIILLDIIFAEVTGLGGVQESWLFRNFARCNIRCSLFKFIEFILSLLMFQYSLIWFIVSWLCFFQGVMSVWGTVWACALVRHTRDSASAERDLPSVNMATSAKVCTSPFRPLHTVRSPANL